MGTIRILPEHLTNRIAAGEVVERPASVVKELAENALDAGGRAIDIVIEGGGAALIRVTDDGCGMDREDLLLAIERHATSKLSEPEDLDAIRTLGFRGEALAAIASVSLMTLTTSTGDGPALRLTARGGAVESIEPVPAAPGTSVEVRSLFFNTPARRKFLKTPAREAAVVAETVTNLALAHPERGFTLSSDGRKVLTLPPGGDLRERAARLLGAEAPLLAGTWESGALRVEAHVSGAGESRADRNAQRVLVNGRPVRDKTIAHAVAGVFGPLLPPGRFPIAVLAFVVPPADVDVNVHPAKSEVRFRRPGEIHSAVTAVLRRALGPAGGFKSLQPPQAPDVTAAFQGLDATPRPLPLERGAFVVSEPAGTGWELRGESAAERERGTAAQRGDAGASGAARGLQDAFADASAATASDTAWEHRRIVGQYRDSYIVASDGEGLLLVDQHAAHERVLFERILAGATRLEIQPLLTPALLEIPVPARLLLADALEELPTMGFEVEPFGESAVVVRAVPAEFEGHDPARLLREILADLGQDRSVQSEEDVSRFPGEDTTARRRRAVAASTACQAAIKVNFPLGPARMAWVLEALDRCREPRSCPHGRPTILRLGHEGIERAFLRR